jgi:hypothetical protein
MLAHSLSDEPTTLRYHRRNGAGLPPGNEDWESWSDLPVSVLGREWFWNYEATADISDIALFSDGVTQVDGMDWRDVVAELLSFKSTEGDFVKRRMNRFLKDCQKHGKGPVDDISMACIHIDHEDDR